jgi:uncharacterized protein (TIGR00369 family)
VSKTQLALQITGFDALYGLEVVTLGEEEATARVTVRDELRSSTGAVHGGVYGALAEGLASLATPGFVQGLSTHATVVSPVREGMIHATARRRHRGRTTWVWEVELTGDDGGTCALVRTTVAVGAPPAG